MTQAAPINASPPTARAPRRYVYCIVDGDGPGDLGPVGIEPGHDVFSIAHEGIAAIVSDTPADRMEISRGAAIAHQRVMEAAMQRGHTVLPVQFNTIAGDKADMPAERRIVDHVLAGKREEILGLLSDMRPVVELGVKGLWTDMEGVFAAIVQADGEIQSLRRRLLAAGGRPANMTAQIRLGERVKKALEARKTAEADALLGRLAPLVNDTRTNQTFGDPMFANLALLVDRSRQGEVEAALSTFQDAHAGAVRLRCVGPLPPCNFLQLIITWDD